MCSLNFVGLVFFFSVCTEDEGRASSIRAAVQSGRSLLLLSSRFRMFHALTSKQRLTPAPLCDGFNVTCPVFP